MAVQDLLSQDEIDALLHGVDDGLVQAETAAEPGSVKSYDLTSQDFDTLATPVGQEMLRQKVTASVQEVAQKELGKVVGEQALFTNFVLQ